MTIEQRIREILAESEPREQKSERLVHLEEFYADMKQKGLVRKNEYSLPPLDTVGRGAAAITHTRAERKSVQG